MDLTNYDDSKAARGVKILEGPSFVHRDEVKAQRSRSQSPPRGNRVTQGLLLGRRQCLVVKAGFEKGADELDKQEQDVDVWDGRSKSYLEPSSGQFVRVVDHGENQKEAVRRLFDAQVLLKSYEEQLTEKEEANIELNKKLKKLQTLKMRSGPGTGQVALTRSVTHANDDNQPTEDDKAALDEERSHKDGKMGDSTVKNFFAKKIPHWLRNDEKSRATVERERANLMRQYMVEGHLDPKLVVDLFWNVGMDFALRWGGEPDEEIVKANKAMQEKTLKVQKSALQETSMLRQHVKKLEKKNQQLIQQLKAMSGAKGNQETGSSTNGMGGNQTTNMRGATSNSGKGGGKDSSMQARTGGQQRRVRTQSGGEGGGGGGGGNNNDNNNNTTNTVIGGSGGTGNRDMPTSNRGLSTSGNGQQGVESTARSSFGQPTSQTPGQQTGNTGVGQSLGGQNGRQSTVGGQTGFGGESYGTGGNGPDNNGMTNNGTGGTQRMGPTPTTGGTMPPGQSGVNARQGTSGQNQFGMVGQGPQGQNQSVMGGQNQPGPSGQNQFGMVGQGPQGQNQSVSGQSQPGVGGRQGLAGQNQKGGQNQGSGQNQKGGQNQGSGQNQKGGQNQGSRLGSSSGFGLPGARPILTDVSSSGGYSTQGPGSPIHDMQWKSLAEDDTLIVDLDQEELEVLDNELFEPLMGLDDDLRELAIDVVNEKVRRILSTDPSKFKGGRLPFGLRPDKLDPDTYQRVRELESELENLKEEHRVLKDSYREVCDQLEAARGRNAQLMQKSEMNAEQPKPQGRGRQNEVSPVQTPSRRGSQESSTPTHSVINKGSSPEEVAAEVKKAVELVSNDLNAKIKELEQKLKASEAQLQTARNKLSDSDKREREASQRAAKAEAAQKRLTDDKKGKSKTDDAEDTPTSMARQKARSPSPTPDRDNSIGPSQEDMRLLEQKVKDAGIAVAKKEQLLKKSLESHKSLLKRMHLLSGSSSSKNKDKVESSLRKGSEDGDASAIPALDEWGNETYLAIRSLLKKLETTTNADEADNKEEPEEEKVPEDEVHTNPEDAEEISRLNTRVKAQQDEISRLLVTIDELRARIESVSRIATDSGPEAATVINATMKKAGLKEIMETGNTPKLKGVFERLYQDALQRITRTGLIRERMLVANQAYSNVVNALLSKEEGVGLDAIPDLDRLSSTAAATLSGMWYHTDFLFRNACDYAIAQGVESSLSKNQILSLAEMMDTATGDEDGGNMGDEDPNSPNFRARRRAHNRDRLPARRGERSKEFPGSAGESGRAFWSLPGGLGSGPKSPRSIRKDKLSDPGPTSFSSYVTALREARGDLGTDEWPRCTLPNRKITKGDGVEFCPKTLKASIAGSRSLPLLPKGRGGIFQTSPDTGIEA